MPPERNRSDQGQQLTRLRSVYSDSLLPVTNPSLLADAAQATHWEPDFRYYLTVLVKRVWLIAGVVLAVTTSATLYALSLPNVYESAAVLRLQATGSSLPGGQAAASSFESYQFFQTQVELLRNPHLIRRAVLKHRLYLDARLLGGADSGDWLAPFRKLAADEKLSQPSATPETSPRDIPEAPEDLTPEQTARLEPYVSFIQQGLSVSPKENTSLITVSFSHTCPECAALVTAAVTETFISENAKFENAGMRSALERAGRQIAEIQTAIQQLEQQRVELLRENNLPLSQGQGRNLTGERVGLLSAQLLAAEDERKRLEADCEAADAAADIWSVPQVAASRAVQDGRAHLRELEKRRQVLLQTYTEQWPEVKKLDIEVKETKAEVESAAREALGSLKATYAAALAREHKLRAAYERENGAANDQSRNSVELTNVNQKIETSRQLYTTLLQYRQKLELDSSDQSNSVSLVSPAIRPQSPVAPARWPKVLMAFFISLAAGIVLALLIEQFSAKLTSVDDVATHLSLQTLGVIPLHQRKSLIDFGRRQSERGDSALTMMEDTRSPTAEAYRNLRTSLLFAVQDEEPQIILITSGQQFEGKTTTSVNLAYAFAQAGAKVLLLDCDLRRPKVHKHFGLANSPGLTDCLTGGADIDALLFSHPDYPSLKVLTAGAMPANPSDYLNSAGMRELLERMRRRFDYVVIDSPPAIPFADAPLLSTMADATLIVVNSRRTNRRTVIRVKERLLQLGSPVSGVVLNYVESDAKDSYYYYGKDERLPACRDEEAS